MLFSMLEIFSSFKVESRRAWLIMLSSCSINILRCSSENSLFVECGSALLENTSFNCCDVVGIGGGDTFGGPGIAGFAAGVGGDPTLFGWLGGLPRCWWSCDDRPKNDHDLKALIPHAIAYGATAFDGRLDSVLHLLHRVHGEAIKQ